MLELGPICHCERNEVKRGNLTRFLDAEIATGLSALRDDIPTTFHKRSAHTEQIMQNLATLPSRKQGKPHEAAIPDQPQALMLSYQR